MFRCSWQDRQPLAELPKDLRDDTSLQAQIEEACTRLNDAKDGKDVDDNLLKACLFDRSLKKSYFQDSCYYMLLQ